MGLPRTFGVPAGGTFLYSGTLAARPAAGVVNRYYWATDEAMLYRDNGVTWDALLPSANSILEQIQTFNGVYWFNNNWLPEGMITSSVAAPGNITWLDEYVGLYTGATTPAYARVSKKIGAAAGVPYTWSKRRLFRARAYIGSYSEQYFHLVTGTIQDVQIGGNNHRHIGFKMIDANLYGTVGTGAAESILLLETITGAGYRRLDCDFTPGVECRFFLDGVDMGTITTNLPTGTISADYLLEASVANDEDANKSLLLALIRCFQEE